MDGLYDIKIYTECPCSSYSYSSYTLLDRPKLLGTSSWPPDLNGICCSNLGTTCSLGSTRLCSRCPPSNGTSRLNDTYCDGAPRSPARPSAACICRCSPCTNTCTCTSAGCAAGPAGVDQHGRSWRGVHWPAGWASTWWPTGHPARWTTGHSSSSASGSAAGTSTGSAAIHAGATSDQLTDWTNLSIVHFHSVILLSFSDASASNRPQWPSHFTNSAGTSSFLDLLLLISLTLL